MIEKDKNISDGDLFGGSDLIDNESNPRVEIKAEDTEPKKATALRLLKSDKGHLGIAIFKFKSVKIGAQQQEVS